MIKNILKGVVVGIANVIPGVSGGTMMVSMGIYDALIHSITHLFKEFKKSIAILAPILIGAALGVVGLAAVIEKMFEFIPIQTNLLFIGLILGGLPAMTSKVKGEKIKPGHIMAFLLFFAVVVGSAALGSTEGNAADLSLNIISIVKLFFVGIVASATMVIPGVSGSMMLMLMGYYNPILETINSFIKSALAFDFAGIWSGFCVLCPFGIGVVIGIFAIAKLVEIIFEKFPLYAYWAIIGLIVASPFAIVLMNLGIFGGLNIVSVLTSVVTFAVGFFIARKLGD
ncbi:MAG: DUF368 domain-containing protein [Lachnospiraceae bacterium]|nr:DUF368 domain-containing protein [Lachnospiraceae bacterium]